MWGNPTLFHQAKKRKKMLTQSIEKSFFYREKAIEKNTEKR